MLPAVFALLVHVRSRRSPADGTSFAQELTSKTLAYHQVQYTPNLTHASLSRPDPSLYAFGEFTGVVARSYCPKLTQRCLVSGARGPSLLRGHVSVVSAPFAISSQWWSGRAVLRVCRWHVSRLARAILEGLMVIVVVCNWLVSVVFVVHRTSALRLPDDNEFCSVINEVRGCMGW